LSLPNSIKNKISSYIKKSQSANKLRNDIEAWFKENGVSKEEVEDILIDSAYGVGTNLEYDIKETIAMLERVR